MDVYAEDLVIDEPYPAGSATLTSEEIVTFATQWDPQRFHIDQEFAAAGHFGEVIASGIHSFAVFQRLAVLNVYSNWRIIAGRAVRELTFPKPVRGGATLSAAVRVTRVERRDDRRSLIHKSGTLIDQSGDLVFSLIAEAYIENRPPSQR